jgi:hypothetical protein
MCDPMLQRRVQRENSKDYEIFWDLYDQTWPGGSLISLFRLKRDGEVRRWGSGEKTKYSRIDLGQGIIFRRGLNLT